MTSELASNLNSFGGNVGGLSSLQASLAASGQGNNSFNPRGMSKLDNDLGFGGGGGGGNSSFGNSSFGGGGGGGRGDFDTFRGDSDRMPGGGGGGGSIGTFSTGGQGGNRQQSNGSRQLSDTIIIGNVREFSFFISLFKVFML